MLKDVGLILVVVRVKSVIPGNFDPTDGGVFARVRFVCYAFSPGTLDLVIDWLIGWHLYLLAYRLIGRLIDWLVNWLTCNWLIASFLDWNMDRLNPWSTCFSFPFIQKKFFAAPKSILKGKVDCVLPDRLLVSWLGLPIVDVPRALFPTDTVYHPEKNCFVWTKKAPLYFEIKQEDEVKFKTMEITYGSDRPIALFDPKPESPVVMTVVGDIRQTSLGMLFSLEIFFSYLVLWRLFSQVLLTGGPRTELNPPRWASHWLMPVRLWAKTKKIPSDFCRNWDFKVSVECGRKSLTQ